MCQNWPVHSDRGGWPIRREIVNPLPTPCATLSQPRERAQKRAESPISCESQQFGSPPAGHLGRKQPSGSASLVGIAFSEPIPQQSSLMAGRMSPAKRWERPSQQKIVLFLKRLEFHGSQLAGSGGFFKPPVRGTPNENVGDQGSSVRSAFLTATHGIFMCQAKLQLTHPTKSSHF